VINIAQGHGRWYETNFATKGEGEDMKVFSRFRMTLRSVHGKSLT
jgi:hypothetical protein